MADEADLAFDSEQRHLAQALAAQRSRTAALKPAGWCHHCGNEEGIAERLFCDSDCAACWIDCCAPCGCPWPSRCCAWPI